MDKITMWDLPDCAHEPDGYDLKRVPIPSRDNMIFLINKINELVDIVNAAGLGGTKPEDIKQ